MTRKEKKALFYKRIGTLWRFAKPYTPLFLVAEICILITYSIALVLPLNLTWLIDKVLYKQNTQAFRQIVISYALYFTVSVVFNLIYAYVWQTLFNRFVVDVKTTMYQRVLFAKADFLSRMNCGDVMSRIDQDADQFIYVIQRNLFHFVNSVLMCGGIIGVVAAINIPIAVVLVVAALVPIVFTRLNVRLTQKYAKAIRKTTGKLSGRLFEFMKGMREIRFLNAQRYAAKKLFQKFKELVHLNNKVRKVDFVVNKGTYLINLSVTLVVYGISCFFILNGHFTIGLFIAVTEYIRLLHRKFNWLLRIYLDWHVRKISIDRVNEILELPQEQEDPNARTMDKLRTVAFQNVSFGYEGERVLQNLSFSVSRGERVALVGASGAGKTTIAGLLLRLFEPQEGQITADGEDLSRYSPFQVRKNVTLVQQDIALFSGTIRENLLLADAGCTEEQLWEACRRVGMEQAVRALPQGLDTPVGSLANPLSMGQKQRLMIAKILLKPSWLVIFDESTASLDREAEELVLQNMQRIARRAGVLVISHRLSTIRSCDRIILLEGGAVLAEGTHEQLFNGCPAYRELFVQKEAAS